MLDPKYEISAISLKRGFINKLLSLQGVSVTMIVIGFLLGYVEEFKHIEITIYSILYFFLGYAILTIISLSLLVMEQHLTDDVIEDELKGRWYAQ